MNGKFELSSNDYDESNLNRPHSVLGAGDTSATGPRGFLACRSMREAGSPSSLGDEFRCQLIKFNQQA